MAGVEICTLYAEPRTGAMRSIMLLLLCVFLACNDAHALDLQLEGKQALVTGSTSGIGYSIARALLGEGADVAE